MAVTENNVWAFRSHDGQDRCHIPPFPVWAAFLRLAQILVALCIVILTGLAATEFRSSHLPGIEMAWFSFAWTVLCFIWLSVAVIFHPVVYHYWAHISIEALTCIWWLVSFALLASEVSALAEYERNVEAFSGYRYYYFYGVARGTQAAIDYTKAAAGIGALEWFLFVVSLVFLVISTLNHRKTEAGITTAPVNQATPVQEAPQRPVQQSPVNQHSVHPMHHEESPEQQAYQHPSDHQVHP